MLDLVLAQTDWFSGATLGGAVLLAIAAIVIGYVVAMIWPMQHHPRLFGCLAAAAFLAALAAAGSTAATMAIALLLAIGAVTLAVGIG
jgi:hypothetical protein